MSSEVKENSNFLQYLDHTRQLDKIKTKFLKQCSIKFVGFVIKKILAGDDPVPLNDFKEYDLKRLEYIASQNTKRISFENGQYIINSQTVEEIKKMLEEIDNQRLNTPQQSFNNDFQTPTIFNAIWFNELPPEQTSHLQPFLSKFSADSYLFVPQENFDFSDMLLNFVQQPRAKILFNPKIDLAKEFDSNGLSIQHTIIKVCDPAGTEKLPIRTKVLCGKCLKRSWVDNYITEHTKPKCEHLLDNGEICSTPLILTEQDPTFFKNLFLYQIKFAILPDGKFDHLSDEPIRFSQHYLFASLVPLHCGIFKAQLIVHQIKDCDGLIISAVKNPMNTTQILPEVEEYAPVPIENQTPYDHLALVKLYHQIQHFLRAELKFNLTNQGFLYALSILTQMLAKQKEYSNFIHTFIIGDKSLGKTFLTEILPPFFFNDIAPTENAGDLGRARYVGGCIKVNSRKVFPGLLPSYDVVKLDEYGNLFSRAQNGVWIAGDLHKLNKNFLLRPTVTVGRGEGAEFSKRAVVIACSNFISDYAKYYQFEVKREYEQIQANKKAGELTPFDFTIPVYKSLEYYNFDSNLQLAHERVRKEFHRRKIHYMLPCELPDLDRFLFLFLVENVLEEDRLMKFEGTISISYEKLLEKMSYAIDAEVFQQDIERNYPTQNLPQQFFKDLEEFFNNVLIKENPFIHWESRHIDLYQAVAKVVADLERTTTLNDNVKQTLTLLFKFVGHPITKKTLDTGVGDAYKTNEDLNLPTQNKTSDDIEW